MVLKFILYTVIIIINARLNPMKDYEIFHTLDEINEWLQNQVDAHELANLQYIGWLFQKFTQNLGIDLLPFFIKFLLTLVLETF